MPSCAVKNCQNWNGNTRDSRISFFRFPKDETIVQKWVEFCKRDTLNLKDGKLILCEYYFLTIE